MTGDRAAEACPRWSRVAKGLYLLGFGTFLLLCTQGILPWSIWGEVIRYWPILLVAAGIRLLFERSALSWIVLLGPFLVLGTIMYVALGGPHRRAAPAEWETLRIDRPARTERWTLEGRIALTKIDLAAGPLRRGVLLEGRSSPGGGAAARVVDEDGACRVRVRNNRRLARNGWWPPRRANRACDLRVSEALPLALDLRLGFTEGTIDLAAAPLSDLDVGGAFNDLTVRLGAPGGDEDVRLAFKGAFNSIELRVPAATPVRVDTEGFVNVVDGREGAASLKGHGYRLRLKGAFNRVVVGEG